MTRTAPAGPTDWRNNMLKINKQQKEDLKKCQIVCKNQKDIADCLNMVEELGFEVRNNDNQYKVIFYREYSGMFENDVRLECGVETYFYNKKSVKTLQKFIKEKDKEKVEDFEVAEDGRIIKINNWMSEKQIFLLFSRDKVDGVINRFLQGCLMKYVDLGLVYSTKEARDKAVFKMEIENKLKNIAERFNARRKIDWEDRDQAKFNICYDFDDDGGFYCCLRYSDYCQGSIYCLDKNFLEVAKKEIGEDNLIKYFKE